MKYLITISYDGTNFYGFQRLNNKRTIQKEIEDALTVINKSKVVIKGAGRTDKNVHAYGQKASFSLDVNIPCDRLINAINSLIGNDIRIIDCILVDNDFHARFNVLEKEYVYKINNGKYDPLLYNYVLYVDRIINMDKLNEISKIFIGHHSFKNFVAGYRNNYEAVINSIDISKENDFIYIKFKGKSFYRYMVRNLVGSMLDYAFGKVSLNDIKESLDNPNINKTFSCASPNGLYLMDVKY